ncbi:MAG: hypothetical protein WD042_09820 [Phycisphaeraceae bacterium]
MAAKKKTQKPYVPKVPHPKNPRRATAEQIDQVRAVLTDRWQRTMDLSKRVGFIPRPALKYLADKGVAIHNNLPTKASAYKLAPRASSKSA